MINHESSQSGAGVQHTKIKISFADEAPLYFEIKHSMRTPTPVNIIHPALFQIAARIDLPSKLKPGLTERHENHPVLRLYVHKHGATGTNKNGIPYKAGITKTNA